MNGMSPPSSRLPATLGRYQIQSLLGRGGMGEVYKAFDPGLDRTVALKTIRADSDSPEFLERLYREARACGRLRHPRIVTVHDLGETDGTVFIAMEYLEGESLASAMAHGELSFELKLDILIQILEALQYAHGEGVIHRDIKPTNVHMLPDRSIKLLDFGLARVSRADSLTMTGAIMGTPYYMSPEQLKGQRVDGRTDVYSTGVLAYELFTHRRAFEADNITAVMLKVLSEEPPPMETAWSAAFPEIERIVCRAVAKSPDDRYATAEDMRSALAAFLASSRAAIAAAQAEVTIHSQRAVREAKTLLEKGQIAESQVVLQQALRADPEAKGARELLQQATQVTPGVAEPAAPPEPRLPPRLPPRPVQGAAASPEPRVGSPSPAPRDAPRPQPVVQVAVPPQRTAVQLPPPRPGVQPVKAGPKGPRTTMWHWRVAWWMLVPAAIVAIGLAAVSRRVDAPAPIPSATPRSPVPASQPDVAGVAAPPPASPGAAPPDQSVAAPSPQTAAPRPAAASAGGAPPAQASVDSRSVYVDASTDAALRSELTTALAARGLTVRPTASGAGLQVSARTDVSVRPSPFGNTSALTADYVATLDLRNVRTGARETLRLDGHALEFGEAVVRAAAIRSAAEQMAAAIEKSVTIK